MTDARVLEIFAEKLDARGADFGRWPERDAEEVHALLARSPEARSVLAEARRLQGLVAQAAEAETPNGFAFRIVGEVAARRSDRLGWLTGSHRRIGFAGATFGVAAFALGVAIGVAASPVEAGASGLDLGAAFDVSLADGDL